MNIFIILIVVMVSLVYTKANVIKINAVYYLSIKPQEICSFKNAIACLKMPSIIFFRIFGHHYKPLPLIHLTSDILFFSIPFTLGLLKILLLLAYRFITTLTNYYIK